MTNKTSNFQLSSYSGNLTSTFGTSGSSDGEMGRKNTHWAESVKMPGNFQTFPVLTQPINSTLKTNQRLTSNIPETDVVLFIYLF